MAQGPQAPGPPKLTPLPHPMIPMPETPPPGTPWWMIAALTLLLLLSAGLLWLLFRNPAARAVPPELPLNKALLQLEGLKARVNELAPDEISHRVSVILRECQYGMFQVPAPWRTTEELFTPKSQPRQTAVPEYFKPVAETYDRLSFATGGATREAALELIDSAITVLRGQPPARAGAQTPVPPAIPTV